jgi:DMSO/TMAO reductase YedYZ molybdopterin-dependent catalytic subunit
MTTRENPPVLDPALAHQRALEGGIVVRRESPLNGEIPLAALAEGTLVPNGQFYVRNHFPVPKLDAESFRLSVRGLVDRALSVELRELRGMRARSIVATLECAGNGRTGFQPAVGGEPWELGAVSTAEWTGVPLADVLERSGVRADAREVVFRGADAGAVEGHEGAIRYERSLTLEQARQADVLLAYAMNDEPLPELHGFPLRAVVPGWYAVASVKWLTELELVAQPFRAHYQTDKYWYEWPREGGLVREPVTRMHVRALIATPGAGARVPRGELLVRGVAWSGAGTVASVQVQAGEAWHDARLVGEGAEFGWQRWEATVRSSAPGALVLRARATDRAGRTQPERAEWNRLGYGNNSIHEVAVQVE